MCTAIVARNVPGQFITQEMCKYAVQKAAYMLKYKPDKFKTQEMCEQAVKNFYSFFVFVPDQLKTREMCENVVRRNVLDKLKKKKMIKYVLDWFITAKRVKKSKTK